jgi:hypothetical protein
MGAVAAAAALGVACGTSVDGGSGGGMFGAAGFEGANPKRQFCSSSPCPEPWKPECAAGVCAPGETCFELTKELGVCDRGQPEHLDGSCPTPIGSQSSFECGCDAGPCPAPLLCAEFALECSCEPTNITRCIEPACTTPADCPQDTVCVPSSLIRDRRCFEPRCKSDAECTKADYGRCGSLITPPAQGGELTLTAIDCFYARGSEGYQCTNPLPLMDSNYYRCP